ncbi:MAG TPA: PaaI family thioesterase [bacterium]|nr:PaaI family thioesterase [bacterium]
MREKLKVFATDHHSKQLWTNHFEEIRAGTALATHDVRLQDINTDGIVMRMEIGDHARQPYGMLHGGVSMLLAESAASLHACWGVNLGERIPVGTEINGSHLRPAREGTVEVEAVVIRRSNTLIHHRFEITHLETGKLLSTGRVTNMYRPANMQ